MADSTTHYGLTKPLGTEYYNISVPNGNMDKIDTALHALGSGLAIIATGDTHAAAASGDFIYIHSHGTLTEGLYKATTSIAQNATLSGSNVTAVTGGGLNALASNTNTALAGKVDKVTGKGLSTNDYTTTEKTKLAGIADGANNYSLPLAASGTRGGIQIGYSQNNKNYPVQLSSEKAYVNVPWTDTTYSDVTTSAHGLMTAADKTKLNGIQSGAQVNPGNATTSAAGLMSAPDKSKLNGIAAGANKILWDVVEIDTGSISAGVLKNIEKVLSLPSSDTLIGISGVYPLYGNLEIRGFSISTANNQKSIILKVKNPSNSNTSDTLYVGYLKNVI